jgi:hypothetical protein
MTMDKAMLPSLERYIHITKVPARPSLGPNVFFFQTDNGYVFDFYLSSNAKGDNLVFFLKQPLSCSFQPPDI